MAFHADANGHSLYHPSEFHTAAGGASAAFLAARAIFRRAKISGTETHHAHTRSAHGVRERALPQHGRMLGTRHGHVHDFGRHLHAGVRFLRGAERQAAGSSGGGRTGSRGRSGGANGIALRGGDFGESRRPAGRRRGNFCPHDHGNSRARARMQSGSADPRFSRRLGRAANGDDRAARTF